MRELLSDTTPDALRVQIEQYRRMTPAEKARRIDTLAGAANQFALAGLRLRHPGVAERELWLRLAVLRLGQTLVERAYQRSPRPDGA